MAARDFDVVILGATGFTGQRILKYLCSSGVRQEVARAGLKIAVAGRNASKLEDAVTRFGNNSDIATVANVDVTDYSSLVDVASRTRVLVSAVGPYRHYGEDVVKACIQAKADYLDVSGEPEFMERMQLHYHKAAAEAGVYIISAVGFDCIPAEIGAHLCTEHMSKSDSCTPHSVQSYLTLNWGDAGCSFNYATYESAVYGFNSVGTLKKVRAGLLSEGYNQAPKIPGPKPKRAGTCAWNERRKAWALPFPGADAAVVRRTMSARASLGLPVSHYIASFTIQSRMRLALFMAMGAVVQLLTGSEWGRSLLLKYPEYFTLGTFRKGGPTEAQLSSCSFTMTHEGYCVKERDGRSSVSSSPDVVCTVKAPEPGYVATPIFVVEGALEVLSKRSQIEHALKARGGVFTPGYVLLLHGKSYLERLGKAGVSITVVSS